MTDPAAPSRPKGWPLLAISLLVLLLLGFLVVQFRKKDEPAVVKTPPTPPPAVVEPAKTPEPVKTPDPVRPPTTDPAPKVDTAEFDQRVKELKAALEGKRWDDASTALAAARKLKADAAELKGVDEAIAEGKKKEEEERAEAARKAALKQQQNRAWALAKDKVEKDRETNLWDAALGALEKFAKDYPDAVRDEDYVRTLRKVREFRDESDGYFRRDMGEARKQFEGEKFGQAIALAETALTYYPERKPEVRKFQDQVREAQSLKTMVRIPSTPCWIGGDGPGEAPLNKVTLPAFLIDKYEVTNEDFFAFCAATGTAAPLHWGGTRPPKGRERHPVVLVTWDEAAAFAAWAGKRLPTAEEWEVAARGPDKREFPWGNAFLEKEERIPANCLEYWQVNKNLNPGTTPVDEKTFDNGESAFGVYGMGGNVWEWTASAAPAKGSKPPPEFRVLKGGSFMTSQKSTRCANVYAEDPRLPHPDVGFRCARDLK